MPPNQASGSGGSSRATGDRWQVSSAMVSGSWRMHGRADKLKPRWWWAFILKTPDPHARMGVCQGADVSPLTPPLSPSDRARLPARAGEGSSADLDWSMIQKLYRP